MADSTRRLTLGLLCLLGALVSSQADAQATPRTIFGVCGSQGNLPTIYFSGVLQGQATAFAAFRTGFQQYLSQQFGYKGAVACLPANTAVIAQNFIDTRSTALRNAKRTVVDTGWEPALLATQSPSPTAAVASAMALAATPSRPGNTAAASSQTAAGSGADQASQMSSVINNVFGTSSSGAGCAAQPASNAKGSKPATSTGGTSASPCQSPFQEVSTVLTGIFGSKSSGGGSAGGGGGSGGSSSAGGAGSQPPAQSSSSGNGALGFGQASSNKLAVYGCGRQDMQVACVTDVTNQNQKETLMQAADVWKSAFIVDDRGDRHQRTAGFFLNVDGDQRSQIDVSYGKTVRFVLMFDSVPTKIQKVALRSGSDTLDVEDINLLVVAATGASPPAGAAAPSPH